MFLGELHFECGETALSLRRFSIHEAISTPYTASVWALSESPTIDLSAIVGQPAALRIYLATGGARTYNGICSYIEQTHAERRQNKVESTYHLRIVPHVWLLDQRRSHKIFQHLSIPDIVDKILGKWGVEHTWNIDRGAYPKHEYRVQYGQTDFAFVSRLLEEAGVAYYFSGHLGDKPTMVLSDAVQSGPRRAGLPVKYEHNPTREGDGEFVTELQLVHDVRPGAHALRDYDFRNPEYKLLGEAPKAAGAEALYEQYHYIPGGTFVETGKGGGTPVADDKGIARHDEKTAHGRATRALEAARADREGVSFESNLADLAPTTILRIENHPHPDLAREVLITSTLIEGTSAGEWWTFAHGTFADVPYRPPLVTPRPEALGVQSAIVVGPPSGNSVDLEIHTDEFGRIRVQFPWDRDGAGDDNSSCWIRVGEGWGGLRYGWLNLPRVGQEVIVTFIDGDPDRPVILGRAHNTVNPVIYKLPDHKTISAWQSRTSPMSEGYNEIKFEDNKDDELFYQQAEKNHRRLVKNDEILTVGHFRDKYVIGEELDTIDGNRQQETNGERHEMIGSDQHVLIKGNKKQLIRGDEVEVNEMNRKLLVLKDADAVTHGNKRERDEWDLNVHVKGDRSERAGQDHSMTVLQKRQEKVGGSYARHAGKEIHYLAGDNAVGEAPDVTLKGAAGFVRIDSFGVTISGTKVDINVSGRPGHGHGARPKQPAEAVEAKTKTGYLRGMEDFQGHGIQEALKESFIKGRGKQADKTRSLELMQLALSLDVSTPRDGAVFWSGGGKEAGAVAEQLANKRTAGGRKSARLEHTDAGKALVKATQEKNDDYKIADPAWRAVSKRLAEHASGEVTMIVRAPVRDTAIVREEVKVLAANKKVTKITCLVMAEDPAGEYTNEDGTKRYRLEPADIAELLAAPKAK